MWERAITVMARQLQPGPAVFNIGITILDGHRSTGATDWQARPGSHCGLCSLRGLKCLAVGRIASQAVPAEHCRQPSNYVPVLMCGKAVIDSEAVRKARTLSNRNREMKAYTAVIINTPLCQIIRLEPGAKTVCHHITHFVIKSNHFSDIHVCCHRRSCNVRRYQSSRSGCTP